MAVDLVDVRAISQANAGIRRSFDGIYGSRAHRIEQADLQRHYLAFEAARYKFDQDRSQYQRREDEDYTPVFRSYGEDLSALLVDPDFERVTSQLRYRPIGGPARDPIPVELSVLFEREEQVSAFAALNVLRDFLFDRVVEVTVSGREGLIKVLPEQKVAPLRFDVQNGRLVVQHHAAPPSEAGAPIVSVAREELVARGLDLVRQLEQSNCDKRLLSAVQDLQERLESSENIIGIGLANLGCEVMYKAFEAELPDAVCATLQVHTMGVGMFLAQFPDWVQFSQAAAAAPLDHRAEKAVISALDSAIAATEGSPELADPEVPRTLRQLRELVTDPRRASKRAVFAAIRSVENLVSKVFSYGSVFLHETISKTSNAVSTTLSKTIAAALLAIGLSAASSLLPISTSVEGLGWIREAVAVVQREITNLPK